LGGCWDTKGKVTREGKEQEHSNKSNKKHGTIEKKSIVLEMDQVRQNTGDVESMVWGCGINSRTSEWCQNLGIALRHWNGSETLEQF
jgi:hypothetical protein